MIAEPTRTINQRTMQTFLGKAAGGCRGALNSLLVILGDKCGLYPTVLYRWDAEAPVVHGHAPSIAQKRTSAFMTLICHECAAGTVSPMGNFVRSVGPALKTVLVVDDDSSIRNLLAEELRFRGYTVIVARNGREALDCLDVMTPDVIVLDLMMPVMDGWTFMERYQDSAGRRSVPIIAVSAEGDLSPGYEALGVAAFLRKPFDLNELANCIAQRIRAREASVAPLSPTLQQTT